MKYNQDIKSVVAVDDLISLNDDDFLRAAFRIVLQREVDVRGYQHYMNLIIGGVDRLQILRDIGSSKESAGREVKLNGYGDLIRHEVSISKFLKRKLKKFLSYLNAGNSEQSKIDAEKLININEKKEIIRHEVGELRKNINKTPENLGVSEIPRAAVLKFDFNYYVENNPDVASSGVNVYEHYFKYGWKEGRKGSAGDVGDKVRRFAKNSDLLVDNIIQEPLTYSESPKNSKLKLIAFYLPQFHPIPENDRWWGRGFTEWTNVTRARQFYAGHEQPRHPGELGFYDLRVIEVMRRQAELARIHGLFGFCFYVYWFAGCRLLDTPLNLLLKNRDININFCYCWANENWTRRWDGLEDDVLISQSHSPEDDIAFISNISIAFKDERYIRIDNKPLLIIYRPNLLPNIKETVARWRGWCLDNGIGDIYISFVESFGLGNPSDMGMDASIQFPPLTQGPHREITSQLNILDSTFSGKIYDYQQTVENDLNYERPRWRQYRSVMPSWDNTARKMERGFSFYGASPELYSTWLRNVATETVGSLPINERIVFVNAWNEWAEGAYLEPDRRRGYAYLNRTREVVDLYSDPEVLDKELTRKKTTKNKMAVILHLHYLELFEHLSKFINNIDDDFDLYISVRSGSFGLAKDLISVRYPDAVVVSYPNHGRDVLPFLKIFSAISKFGYQAICKIHSKKSNHRVDGDAWRDDVLEKLLGSKHIIDQSVSRLKKGAGVIAPAGHLLDSSNYWGSNAARVTELARKMNCPQKWTEHFFFPAGTMFWFSPKALKPLLALNLTDKDFEPESGQVDGTTAHAVERLIALSAIKANLSIAESSGAFGWSGGNYPFAAKG